MAVTVLRVKKRRLIIDAPESSILGKFVIAGRYLIAESRYNCR